MKDIAEHKPGFIKAMWCGDLACEEKIKEEAGLSSRCIPFEQEQIAETCVCCSKPAKSTVYWGKILLISKYIHKDTDTMK